MKKAILGIVALLAVTTLAGCNNSVDLETEHGRIFACGQAVGKYFEISDYGISWNKEEEAGASYVLNGLVDMGNALEEDMIGKYVECIVDMVDKSVTIQESSTEIANPASVFCEKNGGTLEIETDEDGGQYGICRFSDGTYCEEWSYFRGECPIEEPSLGMANPASVFCVKQGGDSVLMTNEDGSQYGVCRFSDGTEVEEWEYFRANNSVEEENTEEVVTGEAAE